MATVDIKQLTPPTCCDFATGIRILLIIPSKASRTLPPEQSIHMNITSEAMLAGVTGLSVLVRKKNRHKPVALCTHKNHYKVPVNIINSMTLMFISNTAEYSSAVSRVNVPQQPHGS
jgi:hypothetical protein